MRGPLFAMHAIFGTVLVIALLFQLQSRQREVTRIKLITQQEHEQTLRMVQDIEQQKALIDGLKSKDPYVIELLARDRLQYTRPDEISPPSAPTPAIDKAAPQR